MSRNRRLRAAALLPLAILGSCAAVGREVTFKVNTSTVKVYEGTTCLSPGGSPRFRLDPSRDHELRFEAEGYEPQQLRIESSVGVLRIVNVVLGTLVLPIVVVPLLWPTWIATGYWYELEPETPTVTLVKVGDSPAATATRRPVPPVPAPAASPRPASPPPPAPASRPTPPPASPPARVTQPEPQRQPPAPAQPTPTPPAPGPPRGRPAFCGTCGVRLTGGAAFCGACGARVGP